MLCGSVAHCPESLRRAFCIFLLFSFLIWDAITVVPLFFTWRPANVVVAVIVALICIVPLYLLRRGSLPMAAMIYLVSMWLVFTVVIELSGGIRSPGLVMYIALPISAAWLFGYRGTLSISVVCVSAVFVFAVLDQIGVKHYFIFPGRPFGIMVTVIGAILIAAVPTAQVMKELQYALAQSQVVQEARAEELQKLMDVAPVALLVAHDAECRQIFANPAGSALFETEAGVNLSSSPKEGTRGDWHFFRDGVAVRRETAPARRRSERN